MGFGHTDTHMHVVLIVKDHDGEVHPRYSRHDRRLPQGQVWNYHVEAVAEAYDKPADLLMIVHDPEHEHPQVIRDGEYLPTDNTLHMP